MKYVNKTNARFLVSAAHYMSTNNNVCFYHVVDLLRNDENIAKSINAFPFDEELLDSFVKLYRQHHSDLEQRFIDILAACKVSKENLPIIFISLSKMFLLETIEATSYEERKVIINDFIEIVKGVCGKSMAKLFNFIFDSVVKSIK